MRRPAESPLKFIASIIAITLASSPGRSQAANSDSVTKKLIALTQRQVEVSEELVVACKGEWELAKTMAEGGRRRPGAPALAEIAWLDARLAALGHRKTLHELQLRLDDAPGARESLLEVLRKRISVGQAVLPVARRHHQSMQKLLRAGRVPTGEVHEAQVDLLEHTLLELSLRKDLVEAEARLERK